MRIEFLPWYRVANDIMRCDGPDGCGALVMSDDAEKHLAWHKRLVQPVSETPKRETRRTKIEDVMCDKPDCGFADVPHRRHRRVERA